MFEINRTSIVKILFLYLFLCWIDPLSGFGYDKNGVSPGRINLPKGPGSFDGLGEAFQPNLNTGVATCSIKIDSPPGTAGHTPQIMLQYIGGRGNGMVGFGWQLSEIFVQLSCDDGIPLYGESSIFPVEMRNDQYITENREKLIITKDDYYFQENESAFIRYKKEGIGWIGHSPDGIRLEFGINQSSRIQHSDNPDKIYKWLLQRTVDISGNVIEYIYETIPSDPNQKYISEIRYGPGPPPWKHYHSIFFKYKKRPDVIETAHSGFMIRTSQRLSEIIVATHTNLNLTKHYKNDFNNDGQNEYLVRKYLLSYLDEKEVKITSSLLWKVRIIGADNQTELPPMTFDYYTSISKPVISAQGNVLIAENTPRNLMDNPYVDMIDLNGDSLPDLLETSASRYVPHKAFINLGQRNNTIKWSSAKELKGDKLSWLCNLESTKDVTFLADMDGDGMSDLVHRSMALNTLFFFRNLGTESWGKRSYIEMQGMTIPPPFVNPDVHLEDMDFDKKTDIFQSIQHGKFLKIWYRLDNNKYSKPFFIEQKGNYFDLSGADIKLADLNGDRIPDITKIFPNRIEVLYGLGYGNFTNKRSILINANLTIDDIKKSNLCDINGDGLADLICERTMQGEMLYWLNQGGDIFSEKCKITDLPKIENAGTEIRWVDINGNGTVDIIYADQKNASKMRAIDIGNLFGESHGINLLKTIDNGHGRITEIKYTSSADYAVKDSEAGNPWPNPMPVPVKVVSEVRDHSFYGRNSITRYSYHDGFYDGEKKQFRGFSHVEELEIGDETSPSLVTHYYYDLGISHDSMKGKLLKKIQTTESGDVFDKIILAYSNKYPSYQNGKKIFFAHLSNKNIEIVELGKTQPVFLESEYDYDDYGNLIKQYDKGIINHDSINDESLIEIEYALNIDKWVVRKPKTQRTSDGKGRIISLKEFYYDDTKFSGKNHGSLTQGLLTLIKSYIDPVNKKGDISLVRQQFDTYGNIIFLADPVANIDNFENAEAEHIRRFIYDDEFHTYPVSEIVGVGSGKNVLSFNAKYNPCFGHVVDYTEPNQNTTTYSYDDFGRLISINKPGDSREYPSIMFCYILGHKLKDNYIINCIETRELNENENGANKKYHISRNYFDGFGKTILKKVEAESIAPNSPLRVVVTEAIEYNSRGMEQIIINPFFSTQGKNLDELLEFESIRKSGWIGKFEHNAQSRILKLDDNQIKRKFYYDPLLRLEKVINPDGTFSSISYAPLTKTIYDENDNDKNSCYFNTPHVFHYDGQDRLIQVDEMVKNNSSDEPVINTWKTYYQYDPEDRLITIIDSQNNSWSFTYDGLSRRVIAEDPNRGKLYYFFDDASNLIRTVDGKGQVILYTYDGVNRLLNEYYIDKNESESNYINSPNVQYIYDKLDSDKFLKNETIKPENTLGLLVAIADETGREIRSYDSRLRISEKLKLIESKGQVGAYRFKYQYDVLDRLKKVTFPDGETLEYAYNDRKLLQSIRSLNHETIISSISYEASAHPRQIQFGNGCINRYEYDERLRIKRISTLRKNDSNSLYIDLQYQLDGASNVHSITDLRPFSMIPDQSSRRNTQVFTYDSLYRLTKVEYPEASKQNIKKNSFISYTYDQIGNITLKESNIPELKAKDQPVQLGRYEYGGSKYGNNNRTSQKRIDIPGPHAVTKIEDSEFTYDANGNLIAFKRGKYTWDHKDRLVAAEIDNIKSEYFYDYTDRRVIKRIETIDPETGRTFRTHFYPDKQFEVDEYGKKIKNIFDGDERIAQIITQDNKEHESKDIRKIHYYHKDHLGSTGVISDSNGNVFAENTYYPFGNTRYAFILKDNECIYGFNQKQQDKETGLYYFESRYLSGSTGRFISPDPMTENIPIDWLSDPQRLNNYTYSLNNPVKYIDSSGEVPIIPVVMGVLWVADKAYASYEAYQDYQAVKNGEKSIEQVGIERGTEWGAGMVLGVAGRGVVKGTKCIIKRSKNIVPWAKKGFKWASEKIFRASKSKFTSTDPLVADLANKIENLYPGHVKGVNVPLKDAAGNVVTDADILLNNAVIQVKSGGGKGLTSQVITKTPKGTDLPVIGYGPDLKGSVVKGIEKAGGLVTRDETLLLEVIKP
ncbi:MAG: VCBS repeat-containing protein [Desulfobacterales bacterium]|nr:VCBS repeat-containing protein [Desulfobacterales bacterium]